jgi:hypothetical protein
MSFFPDDLDLSTLQSPVAILKEAQEEWKERSQGVLHLHRVESELSNSTQYITDVILAHVASGRSAKLLSLRHLPGKPYPVEIQPEAFDYPDYLVKQRVVPARKKSLLGPSILEGLGDIIPQHTITNKWICETPLELRERLAEAFNLGSVKSLTVNLVAGDQLKDIPDADASVEGISVSFDAIAEESPEDAAYG